MFNEQTDFKTCPPPMEAHNGSGEDVGVIDIDVDQATIRHTKKTYGHLKNVSFRTGDCRSIPLKPNSIDLVVSFETIEHIHEHETFVYELNNYRLASVGLSEWL